MRSRPVVEIVAPLPLGLAGLAYGVWQAWGVGDPKASGIVEESLGGPGTAAILMVIFVLSAALGVGVLAGWAVRIRGTALRIFVRCALMVALGLWAGLLVYAMSAMSCDGSCIEADDGVIVASTVVGGVSLLAELALAAVTGRVFAPKAAGPDPAAPATGMV